MLLRHITIGNIRSISHSEIPLKKMNIFIGKNSSGKSSILSALLAIRALTINRNFLPGPFIGFVWLQRRGTKEPMFLQLTGSDIMELIEPESEAPHYNVRPELKIRILPSATFHSEFYIVGVPENKEVREITVSGFIDDMRDDVTQLGLIGQLEAPLKGQFTHQLFDVRARGYSTFILQNNQIVTERMGSFGILRFSYPSITRDLTEIEQTFLTQRAMFSTYFSEMVFISVMRGFLLPDYPLQDSIRHSLTGDTVSSEEILNIQAYKDYRDPVATKRMSEWADAFGIEEFETTIQPGGKVVGRGRIPTEDGGEPLPVSFYGFGSNQFMQVVAKCVFAPEGAPILIEEPEIHLHPEMQALATDFLIETMQEGHQLFITTHSEHMIGRIQRRIAEGRISVDDVAILWVKHESKEEGTIVEEVKIGEEGILRKGLLTYLEFLQEEIKATLHAREEKKAGG